MFIEIESEDVYIANCNKLKEKHSEIISHAKRELAAVEKELIDYQVERKQKIVIQEAFELAIKLKETCTADKILSASLGTELSGSSQVTSPSWRSSLQAGQVKSIADPASIMKSATMHATSSVVPTQDNSMEVHYHSVPSVRRGEELLVDLGSPDKVKDKVNVQESCSTSLELGKEDCLQSLVVSPPGGTQRADWCSAKYRSGDLARTGLGPVSGGSGDPSTMD